MARSKVKWTWKERATGPKVVNKYASRCAHCRQLVEVGEGWAEKVQGQERAWRTVHRECGQTMFPEATSPALTKEPAPFEFRGAPLSDLP